MKKPYSLEDITPREMICSPFPGCPSIYKDKDCYLIIGEKVDPSKVGLEGKVGEDEVLIKVPKKLIDEKVD